MTSLDRFIEPIMVAGKPIGGGYTAYRMDNTAKGRDMRIAAGFGTCHCCDYFLARGDSILLIEETQLLGEVADIRSKYAHLKEFKGPDLDEQVNNRIRDGMQLKAYGAMLVLCRLAGVCAAAKDLARDKKYEFWLVVSALNSMDDLRLFDNLKDSLKGLLKGVLGATLLDNVEVIPSAALEKRLAADARAR